jgi:hypothetical protein
VQRALHLGDVVDVGGAAGHLGAGAFVDQCDVPVAGLGRGFARNFSGAFMAFRLPPAEALQVDLLQPWLSSQKRCIRLPSTSAR